MHGGARRPLFSTVIHWTCFTVCHDVWSDRYLPQCLLITGRPRQWSMPILASSHEKSPISIIFFHSFLVIVSYVFALYSLLIDRDYHEETAHLGQSFRPYSVRCTLARDSIPTALIQHFYGLWMDRWVSWWILSYKCCELSINYLL